MRKCILLLAALFLLCFPLSALSLNIDAYTLPDSQGDNNLYAYAYNYSTNTYHPLNDMGTKYWRDDANVPPIGYAGYRPLIQTGDLTLWGGGYSTYIRLDPSATHRTGFLLTSAKSGARVEEAFMELSRKIEGFA